jgi:protein AaeX
MRFAEVDLFGVYVAPISLLMVVAWVVTIGLRRLAVRVGLLRRVWHPALFVFALFVIILSSLTFVASHIGRALP